MKITKLLFRIHYLASPTTKYFFHLNTIQQKCLLHTCVPLMNYKDSAQTDRSEEQVHMRVEAKAASEHKRMYKEGQ
jgi:hypothetical protein